MFKVKTSNSDDTNKSTFLITVNTNKGFRDRDEGKRYARKLKSILNDTYANFDRYLMSYEKRGRKMIRIYEPMDDLIHSADAEMQLEVGSKFHRLHSHAMIKTTQDENIYFKVDLKKLRAHLIDRLGPIHLDVKFLKDHETDMLKYIRKSLGNK